MVDRVIAEDSVAASAHKFDFFEYVSEPHQHPHMKKRNLSRNQKDIDYAIK